MGQAEDQYLERMRAALLPDTLGTGRVEPSSEKIAADHSLGRSTGFLTEKQPTMQAAAKGALIGGSLGSLAATGFSLASRKIHTPDAQYARGKAKHIGAALARQSGPVSEASSNVDRATSRTMSPYCGALLRLAP